MANFFENDDNLNLLKQDLIEIYKAKTMLGLLYPYKELKIEEIKFSKNLVLIKAEGIDTIEIAVE